MASLQFVGRQAVVDAVNNRGLQYWGLFQGKQFITAGEGTQALDEFLQKLEPGGSAALYTLKVYADQDPEDITDKTECNGSFNFKLSLPAPAGGVDRSITDRLDRIEGMLNGEDEDDEEEDDNSLMGIIMGYLKEPEKLATIIGAFRGMAPASPVNQSPPIPMAIGNHNPGGSSQPVSTMLPGDDQEKMALRVATALDRLEKVDPNILAHLEKLADLAESKPGLFKLLLAQLDGL